MKTINKDILGGVNIMRFSVIMPSYNSEKTISKSIQSVLDQTYCDWELIVIDDGSTDGTRKIIDSFVKKDSRVKVISQKNLGPGEARNNGIRLSSGDYITFLDSDDFWDNSFLELINIESSKNNADVVFYDIAIEDSDGKVIKDRKSSIFKDKPISELIKLQMVGTLMWGLTKAIKRKVIIDNNCFFSSQSVGEEAIFSYDVLCHSSKVSFVCKSIYHYVSNPTGQHLKGGDDPWWPVVSKMKSHLQTNGSINKHDKTVNCLAIKALLICLYRMSKQHNNNRQLKEAIKRYQALYDFNNIDKSILDKKTLLLLPLIKARIVFPIRMMSIIKG